MCIEKVQVFSKRAIELIIGRPRYQPVSRRIKLESAGSVDAAIGGGIGIQRNGIGLTHPGIRTPGKEDVRVVPNRAAQIV